MMHRIIVIKPSVNAACKIAGNENSFCYIKRCLFWYRGVSGSDFRIRSTNNENVIFALVELERPDAAVSNDGLFASALSAFDTV